FGEGQSKRVFAGIVFGIGMAVGAVNFMAWLFPSSTAMRTNPVYKVMNRPLTILGAERRLFFVALLSGAGIFNLVHSLAGGVLLFFVGLIAAQRATKFDSE